MSMGMGMAKGTVKGKGTVMEKDMTAMTIAAGTTTTITIAMRYAAGIASRATAYRRASLSAIACRLA